MDKTTPAPVEIPTALPGFEDDDAREKLLLESTAEESKGETDEEDITLGSEPTRPKKRRWQVVRTLAAFAVFVCILAVAISWFFGMGWLSEQKAQPISRSTSKDGPTSPATEDEKMRMALSLVAEPALAKVADAGHPTAMGEARHNKEIPDLQAGNALPPAPGVDDGQRKLEAVESRIVCRLRKKTQRTKHHPTAQKLLLSDLRQMPPLRMMLVVDHYSSV